MKILIAATSLKATYGGPAYSVSRLASALKETGVGVRLWSADGSRPEPSTHRLAGNDFVSGSFSAAADEFRPSVIHDNGIWLLHNHRIAKVARGRGIPRVVSTRGMLEPWARAYKRFRKDVAWRLYQKRDLLEASVIHASNPVEAENVIGIDRRFRVMVVPNGVDIPLRQREERPGHGAARTALFLGRLHPIKGLPLLIEGWRRARPRDWNLVIAGPDEGGYRATVESLVAEAGLAGGGEVTFAGAVAGAEKERLLSTAHLFVLPSLSESFGMAIAEALAWGLPVLTTTASPWPQLESERAGWRVAPSVEGVEAGLRLATSTSPQGLAMMGDRGAQFAKAQLAWRGIAGRMKAVYERAIGGS